MLERIKGKDSLKFSDFPNIEIIDPQQDTGKISDDDNYVEPDMDIFSGAALDNLENTLLETLKKNNPVKAKLVIYPDRIKEDKVNNIYDSIKRNLYTKNRKHSGAILPLFTKSSATMYGVKDISSILSATDILKRITNSRPNRRHIASLKDSLTSRLSSDPNILRSHQSFITGNGLKESIPIGDFIGMHILKRLETFPEHTLDFLHNALRDKKVSHPSNAYHNLINDILENLVSQHIKNRKII